MSRIIVESAEAVPAQALAAIDAANAAANGGPKVAPKVASPAVTEPTFKFIKNQRNELITFADGSTYKFKSSAVFIRQSDPLLKKLVAVAKKYNILIPENLPAPTPKALKTPSKVVPVAPAPAAAEEPTPAPAPEPAPVAEPVAPVTPETPAAPAA